jgi:hypothetical protein
MSGIIEFYIYHWRGIFIDNLRARLAAAEPNGETDRPKLARHLLR